MSVVFGTIRLGEPLSLQPTVTLRNRQHTLCHSASGTATTFFFTKEYIHAIPHRQPWLHGAYLQIN